MMPTWEALTAPQRAQLAALLVGCTPEQQAALYARIVGGLVVEGDCWLWTAGRAGDRTPTLHVGRAAVRVRPLVYAILTSGPPPPRGLGVACERPRCVGPTHIRPHQVPRYGRALLQRGWT